MARLPSFQRYGSSEYPLAVALKKETSQGYRDAWTVAWSDRFLVGAWVGRPDASPMAQVSGARSAAALVQSVLLGLHEVGPADLHAGEFLAPPGRVAVEVCAYTGRPGASENRQPEFVSSKVGVVAHAGAEDTHLAILQPPTGTHAWRNPELPDSFNKLALRASVSKSVKQVTWMVDGVASATIGPGEVFCGRWCRVGTGFSYACRWRRRFRRL
jgi:penicillin-binding protein 1C